MASVGCASRQCIVLQLVKGQISTMLLQNLEVKHSTETRAQHHQPHHHQQHPVQPQAINQTLAHTLPCSHSTMLAVGPHLPANGAID